jgi:DNA/RNA-binding domain of Phe-tRNA-synthetase-like protein
VRGLATLRRGGAGESYPGIRKEDVHVEGRLVLADERGPFGNPTSDSLRTSVTEATTRLWMVVFAPSGFPSDLLASHVKFAQEAIARHLAGPAAAVTTTSATAPCGRLEFPPPTP